VDTIVFSILLYSSRCKSGWTAIEFTDCRGSETIDYRTWNDVIFRSSNATGNYLLPAA